MKRRLCLLFAALCLLALGAACAPPAGVGSGVSPSVSPPAASPAAPPSAAPEPAPSPSPTAVPEPPPETLPPEAPEPAEPGEETMPVMLGGITALFPAETALCPLRTSPSLSAAVTIPTGKVYSVFTDNAWRFYRVKESEGAEAGADPAFLEISLVSGTNAEELLPCFMDAYLDFQDIAFSTAASLGRQPGPVGTVVASGEELLAEAWLLDVEDGVVAVVLCGGLDRADDELRYLTAVLNTFLILEE